MDKHQQPHDSGMDFPFKLLQRLPTKLPGGGGVGGGSSASASAAPLSRFLSLPEFLSLASSKKIVWFGEYHSEERICSLLERLVAAMGPERGRGHVGDDNDDGNASGRGGGGRLHVVCEQFSFEMQGILDRYQGRRPREGDSGGGGAAGSSSLQQQQNPLDFDGLVGAYKEIGTEGHDLAPYRSMLEYCRLHSESIELHGGFLPRPYAAAYMKAPTDDERVELYRTLSQEKGFLPDLDTLRAIDGILGLDEGRLPMPSAATPSSGDSTSGGKLSKPVELHGSPGHYSLFESLMSGRDVYGPPDEDGGGGCPPPAENHRKIFQAQLMKDWAMAWRLRSLVDGCAAAADHRSEDRFLVLAGRAHLSHRYGVPEIYSWLGRAAAREERVEDELLVCSQMMYECDLDEREQKQDLRDGGECERIVLESELVRGSMLLREGGCEGGFERPAADVLYVYDEEDWEEEGESDEEGEGTKTDGGAETATTPQGDSVEAVKRETVEAYDQVGETASKRGNVAKAKAILTYLGYTPKEQEIIGQDDIYNYQGVGNPFRLARIEAGERVIDLGSGLGVDSFLAAHYAGTEGEVCGVDISKKEVRHANARAAERGVSDFVSFRHGDIEKLSGVCPDDYFDVAISNGAFCLAPDKRRAFENVFRVLKPGGRMSICTTTVKKDLDVETQWPVCMRMFVHLDKIRPICEEIGFKNVVIDTDDSELEFELEGVTEEDFDASRDDSGRAKIHVGSNEFSHLQDYDMNDICARVVVYGEK